MAAEVSDKTPPPSQAHDAPATAGAGAASEKTFMTVSEAQRQQADSHDLDKQNQITRDKTEKGAAEACHKEVGDGKDIANNPAVRASVEGTRSTDPSVQLSGDQLSFPAMSDASLEQLANGGGDKGAAAGRDSNLAAAAFSNVNDAQSGRQQDLSQPQDSLAQPQDRTTPQQYSDAAGQPGDNNVRDVNPQTDNPQAVTQRYDQMVDNLHLPADKAAQMKDQFNKDLEQAEQKFKGDDLSHVMRSMNLMMDSNNHLLNDSNRVNAVSGLAARAANPEDANRQGANPTCALTSESRIEQERNFVKYADQMGSVAAKGGAWRGGQNGESPAWINVDAAGTNHANFIADSESSHMYSHAYDESAGHRDYLGQLDNAVVGGEMAHYASQRDNTNYVYVAANSQRVPGADSFGQGATGGALMERAGDGTLKQAHDGDSGEEGPPSTLDMVAQVNHANGGGGSFVQENLAAQFRRPDGSYPPGMNVFKDAADLRQQLANKQPPGEEYQILTNGVIVAGKQGHGLHAQEVSLNKQGQLEFGNNWDDAHNHKVYSDSFVNTFTNPKNWDNYVPQHTMPDGVTPDWRRERVDPGQNYERGPASPNNPNDKNKENEDAEKKAEDKEKKTKDQEAKKEQSEEKQHAKYMAQLQSWEARKDAFMAANPGKEFSEAKPVEQQA